MITEITRSKILENPVIRFSVGSLQRNLENYRFTEANTSQEVEEWQVYFEQVSDVEDFDEIWQEKYAEELILTTKEQELSKFLAVFPQKLQSLFESMEVEKLYFLLEIKENWFEQVEEIKLKKLLDKFSKLCGKSVYEEGFAVNTQDFSQFFEFLFWTARQNLQMSPIWFGTETSLWVANICEYGNIHFHFYAAQVTKNCKKQAQKLGLQKILPKDEVIRV